MVASCHGLRGDPGRGAWSGGVGGSYRQGDWWHGGDALRRDLGGQSTRVTGTAGGPGSEEVAPGNRDQAALVGTSVHSCPAWISSLFKLIHVMHKHAECLCSQQCQTTASAHRHTPLQARVLLHVCTQVRVYVVLHLT